PGDDVDRRVAVIRPVRFTGDEDGVVLGGGEQADMGGLAFAARFGQDEQEASVPEILEDTLENRLLVIGLELVELRQDREGLEDSAIDAFAPAPGSRRLG